MLTSLYRETVHKNGINVLLKLNTSQMYMGITTIIVQQHC